jgi:hypothetical protein
VEWRDDAYVLAWLSSSFASGATATVAEEVADGAADEVTEATEVGVGVRDAEDMAEDVWIAEFVEFEGSNGEPGKKIVTSGMMSAGRRMLEISNAMDNVI